MGGSKLDANTYLKWITFKCKSTQSASSAVCVSRSTTTTIDRPPNFKSQHLSHRTAMLSPCHPHRVPYGPCMSASKHSNSSAYEANKRIPSISEGKRE